MTIHSGFRSGGRLPHNPPPPPVDPTPPKPNPPRDPTPPRVEPPPVIVEPPVKDPTPPPVIKDPPAKDPTPPVVDSPSTDVTPPAHSPSYTIYDLSSLVGPYFTPKIYDESAPEYEPYHFVAKGSEKYGAYWNSKWNFMPYLVEQVATTANYYLHELRTVFYQTEFEMLGSYANGEYDLRASRNLGVSDTLRKYLLGSNQNEGRKYLYSQSYQASSLMDSSAYWLGSFKSLFWDKLKRGYYEVSPCGRTDAENAVKVAEIVPRILLEKGREVQEDLDGQLTDLVRKCYVVLKDGKYDNERYLNKLLGELHALFDRYHTYAVQLETSSQGSGKSSMQRLKNLLHKAIEKPDTLARVIKNRERYHVDRLQTSLNVFFERADHISENVRKTHSSVLINLDKLPNDNRIENLRAKINELITQLGSLRDNNQKRLYEFGVLVEHFEKTRPGAGSQSQY